jgi:hypothetical protein
MNKIALAVFLALLGTVASATLVTSYSAPLPRVVLFPVYGIAGLAGGTVLGSTSLPDSRGFTIQTAEIHVYGASGGGAGNTVLTWTDGTNSCTGTWACTATNSTGNKQGALAGTAGSGCTFPAAAVVSASVTTAGCTTTQPSVRNLLAWGVYR